MIYVLTGNDFKKKNAYVEKISRGALIVVLDEDSLNKENILSFSSTASLFGETTVVIIDSFSKTDIDLSKKDIEEMSSSLNIFIFLEEKLLAVDFNKFKKIATVEDFIVKEKLLKGKSDINFSIADSFAKRDKFETWLLYKNAISAGVLPEEISGTLFWKIKTMILTTSRYFSKEELKIISSKLVKLHHDSHLGKKDFVIGLEQFILTTLEAKQR